MLPPTANTDVPRPLFGTVHNVAELQHGVVLHIVSGKRRLLLDYLSICECYCNSSCSRAPSASVHQAAGCAKDTCYQKIEVARFCRGLVLNGGGLLNPTSSIISIFVSQYVFVLYLGRWIVHQVTFFSSPSKNSFWVEV